ncbi:hypothetical protein R0135_00360 [Congregibacter variabilis]|uniref:Oxygen tolerance n=1 Tax=Congregibacter variabilis TaxID=3081200 RepID=A0ABZ0I379_9GAMM|nr:hypothetical protein R0135_00360 [Congregibacter sp. IMCC43200]
MTSFLMARFAIAQCQLGRLKMLLATLFATLMLITTDVHAAMSLDKLVADKQLQASVSIDTPSELYQRAPFTLSVEVATARWFSRGTRVRDFRIPGAVVRPVSSFADNSSRRIDGETWSVQRWRFRVFPQDAGLLTIPGIRVFVSVNTATDGAVEGELLLNPISAQIVAPPGFENLSTWIASPSLSIEQRWEGLLDNYMPGDAITRTRSFVVQDAPGMMLEASQLVETPGLSLYAAPAKVVDKSNRGTLTGTRTESLVITFEAPGQYRIPGLDYVWFNTNTGTLETVSLPELEVEVLAAEALPHKQKERFDLTRRPPLIIGSASALLLALLLWFSRNSRPSRTIRSALERRLQRRRSCSAYLRALQSQDTARCIQLLYQQLAESGSQRQLLDAVRTVKPNPERSKNSPDRPQSPEHSLRLLLDHAYGKGITLPNKKAARELWNVVSGDSIHKDDASRLELNPSAS